MAITFKNFTQLVADAKAKVQSVNANLNDVGPGSPLGAIINVIADTATFLQGVAAAVLTKTRLSSSTGADVDSFVGDFGMTRLPASSATGQVSFGRATAPNAVLLTPGTQVKTADGSQTFSVIADHAHPQWNGGMGGFLTPIGMTLITIPVRADVAGSAGNVQAGTINLISSSTNFNTVSNANPFVNGVDAEDDESVKERFPDYLNTKTQATYGAISYAIRNVQQNLSFNILENTTPGGLEKLGYFAIILDDSTGTVTDTVINTVSAAVNAVKPVGTNYGVAAAVTVPVTVTAAFTAAVGYDKATVGAAIDNAIRAFVAKVGVGQTLFYNNLITAVSSVEGVAHLDSLTVNGAKADLPVGRGQVTKVAGVGIA